MADRRPSENTQRSPDDSSAVFDVLSTERRRFALHCLREYATPMPLADLADEIVAWEHDTSVADVPAEEVKRIYLSLYHKHIPKMEDVGLVQYDQEQDAVELLEHAEEVEQMYDLSIVE